MHCCTEMQKWSLLSAKKEDIEFQNLSMYFSVDMFHKLPHHYQNHKNPYSLYGLFWYYFLQFDPKLEQVNCEIRLVPCAYNVCTYQLDLPFITTLSDDK